jgi:hypothetical protein
LDEAIARSLFEHGKQKRASVYIGICIDVTSRVEVAATVAIRLCVHPARRCIRQTVFRRAVETCVDCAISGHGRTSGAAGDGHR